MANETMNQLLANNTFDRTVGGGWRAPGGATGGV
jgi:hypothetical protein